jgi:predicted glycoside hydrolase/deacetylase ChbG (UPF0249 family)
MTRVVLCADDFGISPGVDEAILELISMKRLTAVSCIVDYEQFAKDGPELARYREYADIGLHLTLTQARPLWRVMAESLFGLISSRDVSKEIERQIRQFEEVMGFLPAYIDGHQHVHNLRVVCTSVAEWASKIGAYVRVTAEPLSVQMLRRPVPFKTAFLAVMGRGLARECVKRGVKTNSLFRGARNFYESSYRDVFVRTAAGVCDATIITCHPGWPDDVLVERDPIVQPRMAEMQYLKSKQFELDLLRLGLALTPLRLAGDNASPWRSSSHPSRAQGVSHL